MMKMNDNLEFVTLYKELKLNVFPCKPNSKEPAIAWKQYQNSKYEGSFQPDQNLAVICGKSSENLVVLDIDSPELIPDLFSDFELLKQKTLVVETGSGGYHIYVRPESLPSTMRLDNKNGQHIDIQSEGTYVIAPPSIHPNDNQYKIISKSTSICNIDIDEFLNSLKKLGFDTNHNWKPIHEIVKGVGEGDRNNSAFKYTCHLLDTIKLDLKTTWYELQRWNNDTNKPPLEELELKTVYESAIKTVEHDQENSILQNTDEEAKKIGLSFAHNPHILEEIQKDLTHAHVGDEKNKVLITILLASSKRIGHEQAIIIQKQSSAGGSNLQNSCLAYFDNKITLTRMTGAYLDRSEIDYTGKILSIGEMSGFDSTSSSLRQKLSEAKTELATTDKDEKGRIITRVLKNEGRPTFITTTTSYEIDQELDNRCWKLSVDETSNQTKSVNKYQFSKDTFEYEGWIPNPEIKALFNSGILEDHRVVNPFTELLGENFPCDNVTARRDSKRFSELITTITYIHQHQRIKIKTKNQTIILTSYDDLRYAINYGQDALKNTLNKLNEKESSVIGYMKSFLDFRTFTRNELCDALNTPYETMKRILRKLVDRSFVEAVEEDRIWKYKLRNKSLVEGISLGLEADFTKVAIESISKSVPNFEEIVLPANYTDMAGPDAVIIECLLSCGRVVTVQNSNGVSTVLMPVTTLPLVHVTDTKHL